MSCAVYDHLGGDDTSPGVHGHVHKQDDFHQEEDCGGAEAGQSPYPHSEVENGHNVTVEKAVIDPTPQAQQVLKV